MPRGRPVTNRSNHWSKHHYGMLVTLAKQVHHQFQGQFEMDELINVGWYRQARYYADVTGQAAGIKREMYNYAKKECIYKRRMNEILFDPLTKED